MVEMRQILVDGMVLAVIRQLYLRIAIESFTADLNVIHSIVSEV